MYQSRFIFDLGARWDRDWSQTDFIDDRAARLGTFTRLDSPHSGSATGSRWRGTQNTLTIVRDEQEHVVDLHRAVNEAPLGGADGLITRQLRDRRGAPLALPR